MLGVARKCRTPIISAVLCAYPHAKHDKLINPVYMYDPSDGIATQGKGDGMKEECIAYVLKQTLQGLKYFHDQGQVRGFVAEST